MNSDQQALFEGATSDLIDYVMRYENLELRPAMDVVYRSQLFPKLENPKTGLYREGPVYLYDMLCRERGMRLPLKKIRSSRV